MMKQLFLHMLLMFSIALFAQEEEKDTYLPQANADFAEKKYADAEANYRISQSKFPKKATAAYNLGNTIYKINQPAEAKSAYIQAIKNASTRAEKHQAFHNLGNSLMKEKDYKAAVDAYKNALINNPADEETRYNYALAKKYLKENPPKEDKKDKKKDQDKEDKKEQDKEDKKPDDQPNKEDKKDDGNNEKNDDKSDQQKPKPQPKPSDGISKQRVENLLEAVNNEERKVQDKVKAKQIKGKPTRNEKDW